MNTPLLRRAIMLFSLAGSLFFVTAFVASFVSPGFVERVAKELIRQQVEKRVHEKIESLSDNVLVSKARALARQHETELSQVKDSLARNLPERINTVVAEMFDLDCECRRTTEQLIRDGYERRISLLSQGKEKLTEFIRVKYMQVASELTREYRIFTATHAFVFLFLSAVALMKRQASLLLLPPALVLLLASLINGYLYLFNQNWLHTILFSDYVGFAYVAYMAVVFAFLCDIAFNRCRVIRKIFEHINIDFSPPC